MKIRFRAPDKMNCNCIPFNLTGILHLIRQKIIVFVRIIGYNEVGLKRLSLFPRKGKETMTNSGYTLYLDSSKNLVEKDRSDTYLPIYSVNYDTIAYFFHTNLAIGFIGEFANNMKLAVIYHPGQTKDILLGSLAVAQIAFAFVGLYRRSNELTVLLESEEQAMLIQKQREMSIVAMQTGLKVPGHIHDFMEHFKDAKKFPEEGYYTDIFGAPKLRVRGKIQKAYIESHKS